MPRYNPFTGQLDYTGVPVKSGTAVPNSNVNAGPDGLLESGYIVSDGILYFRAGGNMYKLTGTLVPPNTASNPMILKGQPIGLMGVTYAEDVF
jgi:hypothetical protein